MSELLELAARCEAAEGPDRELDAEIWLACVPNTTRKETRYVHAASGSERVIDETRENYRLVIVPAYTASLDAAMTLVPEGWIIAHISQTEAYGTTRAWFAEVRHGHLTSYAKSVPCRAASPALALCAAALRAHSTQGDQ